MYASIFKTPGGIGNKNAAGPHKMSGGNSGKAKESPLEAKANRMEEAARFRDEGIIPRTPTQEKRHQKDLQSENWHTKTMAAFKDKSNDALKFIQQDAAAAAKANPNNPKAGQYMDEVHYASMELKKRREYQAKTKKADNGLFGIHSK